MFDILAVLGKERSMMPHDKLSGFNIYSKFQKLKIKMIFCGKLTRFRHKRRHNNALRFLPFATSHLGEMQFAVFRP